MWTRRAKTRSDQGQSRHDGGESVNDLDEPTQYQAMITESQSSMTNLESILTTLKGNLAPILDGATIALGLFLAWLLAAQVVILSQGWELYHGTAGRMEGPAPEADAAQTRGAEAQEPEDKAAE